MRSDEGWPAIDICLENEITAAIIQRGPERQRLIDQVAVVASIVDQRGGAQAAARYLRRSLGWVSKHLHLHRTNAEHRWWTFWAMTDDYCKDVEIAYVMSLIEAHDTVEASTLYARLRQEAHERRVGPRDSEAKCLSRETIRSQWREVKRKAHAADQVMRPAAAYRRPSPLATAGAVTPP